MQFTKAARNSSSAVNQLQNSNDKNGEEGNVHYTKLKADYVVTGFNASSLDYMYS